MKCFQGTRLGSLEGFEFADGPQPVPGPGQVVVRNEVAALGFVDGLIIEGLYRIKPSLPYIPGGEIAGVVDAVGEGVVGLAVGSRIATGQLGGGLAEYSVVPASEVDIIPDELSFVSAAAMLVDYQTARYALMERGRLRAGDTVLVMGAAGGVGSAAVQLARRAGARVIAAASDREKRNRAYALGANATVSSISPDIRNEIKLHAPEGIDIVFDPVGGSISETLFRSLAKEGRHLVVGFAAGSISAIPANLALLKSASLVGVDIRHYLSAHPEEAREARSKLFHEVSLGDLSPPLTTAFGLDQSREALLSTKVRNKIGKVVVLPAAAVHSKEG